MKLYGGVSNHGTVSESGRSITAFSNPFSRKMVQMWSKHQNTCLIAICSLKNFENYYYSQGNRSTYKKIPNVRMMSVKNIISIKTKIYSILFDIITHDITRRKNIHELNIQYDLKSETLFSIVLIVFMLFTW